jgi:hypothetical protein
MKRRARSFAGAQDDNIAEPMGYAKLSLVKERNGE